RSAGLSARLLEFVPPEGLRRTPAKHRAVRADHERMVLVGIAVRATSFFQIAKDAPLRIEKKRTLLIQSAHHVHAGGLRRNDEPVSSLQGQLCELIHVVCIRRQRQYHTTAGAHLSES